MIKPHRFSKASSWNPSCHPSPSWCCQVPDCHGFGHISSGFFGPTRLAPRTFRLDVRPCNLTPSRVKIYHTSLPRNTYHSNSPRSKWHGHVRRFHLINATPRVVCSKRYRATKLPKYITRKICVTTATASVSLCLIWLGNATIYMYKHIYIYYIISKFLPLDHMLCLLWKSVHQNPTINSNDELTLNATRRR